MRKLTKTVAAIAALGAVEFAGSGTPMSVLGVAHADTLPAVWQNKLRKLTQNIETSRQRLAASGSEILADDFKARQLKGLIDNYAASLARVPASSDPMLATARTALETLQREFAAAEGGAPAGAAPAAPAAAAAAAPATSTAPPATVESPAVPAASATGDVRPLVSGERVRVKKLTRDLAAASERITTEGPSLYQDPQEYEAAVTRFSQFTDALKRYPQADDPDVQAARQAYTALRTKLEPELARGAEQREILGDVMGNLRALQARDREYPVPPRLEPPFSEDEVRAWAKATRAARDAARRDYTYLQDIAPIAYLPDFTKSGRKAEFGTRDLPRLAALVKSRNDSALAGYGAAKDAVTARLEELERQVMTPDAGMSAAEMERSRTALDQMLPVAESLVNLERGLDRPTEEAEAVVAATTARRTRFEADLAAAIDAVRMPEARSTDADRLAIAKKILETPRYEFGEYGPIVLNTEKILEKTRKESEIEIDDIEVYGGELRMSGTKEDTVWNWKEFQFATALREPGTDLWRITYIKPKFFTSGASTTPLNDWISGGVVEGDLIRAENIGR